jgi:hypothetical protein
MAFVALCEVGVVDMEAKLKTFTPDTIAEQFQDAYDVEERRMGELVLGDTGVVLYTVERPFLANPRAPGVIDPGIPYESSVPLGEYELVLRDSPGRGGERWHFVNEDLGVYLEKEDTSEDWHRFSCMFHVGNYVTSVVGCAGVGMRLHDFKGDKGLGVAASRVAHSELMRVLSGANKHRLVIS